MDTTFRGSDVDALHGEERAVGGTDRPDGEQHDRPDRSEPDDPPTTRPHREPAHLGALRATPVPAGAPDRKPSAPRGDPVECDGVRSGFVCRLLDIVRFDGAAPEGQHRRNPVAAALGDCPVAVEIGFVGLRRL